MQPFYIGQRVISVSKHDLLPKGKEYIVMGLKERLCPHYPWVVDVGVSSGVIGCGCNRCKISIKDGKRWFEPSEFIPIQEDFQAISFSKIMEEELTSVN